MQLSASTGFAAGDNINTLNPFSFTGGAYLNQSTGEIVIAYKGTDFLLEFSGRAWNTVADLAADLGLAFAARLVLGIGHQLNASAYYLAVKDWAVENGHDPSKISFTGHSLGGGLAANMAVWYDRPATTFAAAPFEANTINPIAIGAAILATTVQAAGSGSIAVLEEINKLSELLVEKLLVQGELDRREAAVTNFYNEGEFLQYGRLFLPTVVGEDIGIDLRDDAMPLEHALGLHSMNLHAAFLFDDQLRQLAKTIPELIPALLDTNLYAFDPNGATRDLVTSLVNDQLQKGLGNPSALTRFSSDIAVLQASDEASANPAIQKALIALVMDFHYHAPANNAATLLRFESGALHFDLADISSDFLKGLALLRDAVSNTAVGGDPFETRVLNEGSVWHIQRGSGAMNWQETSLANDVAVGGAGADILRSGGGSDHLIGGAGDDVLDGGAGNDLLLGGNGSDTYVFQTGHGQDVIIDADGLGSLVINGQTLAVGEQSAINSGVWEDTTGQYRIARIDETILLITAKSGQDSITIKSWSDGDLGLVLGDDVGEPETPKYNALYLGDQRALRLGIEVQQGEVPPQDPNYGRYRWGETSWLADGTLQGGMAQADFADVISAAWRTDAVQMFGLGGNDALTGGSGDDRIEGGDGDDLISGGEGADHILGGAGSDVILGGHTVDVKQRQEVEDSFSAPAGSMLLQHGPTWARYWSAAMGSYVIDGGLGGSGANTGMGSAQGDYIDAGDGDDWVMGSEAADTILGGQGNDALWGGGGGDYLLGGEGRDFIHGDGSMEAGSYNSTAASLHGNDLVEGGAGDDVIVGGGGADYLLGGADNDLIFGDNNADFVLDGVYHGQDVLLGEGGNDQLVGGGGNDILFGGEGDDMLFGDDISNTPGVFSIDVAWHGHDQLYGGAGDDLLVGGAGNDYLDGGDDNDEIWGDGQALDIRYHGNDTLIGGKGDDVLHGEGGDDVLDGGEGTNHLYGGAGNDTYIVRTADLAQATPPEGQQAMARTVIGDTEGRNVLRLDVLRQDVQLVPSAGAGLGLMWSAGSDALGQPQVAVVLIDSLTSAATLSLEFADGQRLDLGRWMGDELNAAVVIQSWEQGAAVAGGAGNDVLAALGGRSQVIGGKGDDSIELAYDRTVVRFDRGDGRDEVQGWGSGHTIAFGAGIAPADVQLRLKPSGQLAIGIDGPENDEIVLPVWRWEIASTTFLGGLEFANGSTMSWQALLATGLNIEAEASATTVSGTDLNDRFVGMPDGATLHGGEGNDEYVFASTEATFSINDSRGLNRITLGDVSNWNNVTVERAPSEPNDLLLTVGDLSIRLTNALVLSDRFELALGNGSVRHLAAVIREMDGLSIMGTPDHDVITMSDQASTAFGDWGNDILTGGAGNDLLEGGSGNDTLNGRAGSDLLLGGEGDDVYLVDFSLGEDEIIDTQGSNTVRFGPGVLPSQILVERLEDSTDIRFSVDVNRTLTVRRALEGTIDRYEFSNGAVWTPQTLVNQTVSLNGSVLAGDDTDNTIQGTSGDDFIAGRMGNDVLNGHSGDDEILGGEGDDTITGGWGNDILNGGAGNDRYEFSLGDGVDILNDLEGEETVRFGAGILPSALVATRESIEGVDYIRLSYSTNDAILIHEGVQFAAVAFEFANGARWGADALFSEVLAGTGAAIVGTSGHDNLFGYASADTLEGMEGADTLTGGAGDDTLDGGEGADLLIGGAGTDSYVMAAGSGADRIEEIAGQSSRLVLSGIAIGELSFARIGSALMVAHTKSNATAFVRNAFTPGSSWTLVEELGMEHDLLSIAASAIASQTQAQRKAAFAQAVGAQAGPAWVSDQLFSEPDSVSTGVGTKDERVFHFSTTTQRIEDDTASVALYGNAYANNYSSEYLGSVSGSRSYQITNVTYNVTESWIAGRTYDVTHLISGHSSVPIPSGAVITEDNGRFYLTEAPRLETFFTPVTTQQTITENYTDYYFRTTYTGERIVEEYVGGASSNHVKLYGSASKIVSAGGGDDVIERVDEKGLEDTHWGTASGADDWIDGGDGDDRIYAGLGNDEVTGGAGSDYIDAGAGSDTYVVSADEDGWDVLYDSAASTVFVELRSSYYGHLDPQMEAEFRALLRGAMDENELPGHGHGSYFGYDAVGGYLPLTAASLNALMDIDSRRPAAGQDNGAWGVTHIRSDGLDALIAQVTGTPLISYTYSGDGPETKRPNVQFQDQQLVSPVVDTVRFEAGVQTSALQLGWTLVATDHGQKQALSVSWGGDGGVHVVVPDEDSPPGVGIERFEFSDGTVWSLQQMLDIAPARPAHAPQISINTPINPVEVLEGDAWGYQIPVSAFAITGDRTPSFELRRADGADWLPSWLSFDPLTGTLSGTPGNADIGELQLQVTAILTDTQRATQMLTLNVNNTNHAPVISGGLSDLNVIAGEVLNWTLSPYDVHDEDLNDRYSYTVQRMDAPNMPDWLSFDPMTGRLQGQPASSDVGQVQLRLTVRDSSGATDQRVFIVNVNAAPTQYVWGTEGNDVLIAGLLASHLYGLAGDDEIWGSTASDVFSGGLGNDTYLFGRGDGSDTILAESGAEPGQLNTLEFKVGIVPTEVLLSRVDDALVLTIAGTTDSVTVNAFFDSNAALNPVQQVRFADGTVWNVAQMQTIQAQSTPPPAPDYTLPIESSTTHTLADGYLSLVLTGTAAIDGSGNAEANHLTGNSAANVLSGGAGDDTYLYHLGGGTDTLIELDGQGHDTLRLGDGIHPTPTGTRPSREGSDLILTFGGAGNDQVRVSGYFDAERGTVETIAFANGK
ncbi:calcium-binding protein, partial [Hydrogenophaga sp.]|uniref:calcium-binding protein n=1 Tax=Hydrogenophaga sp. TaxID=1904254 RepID=UPI003F707272